MRKKFVFYLDTYGTAIKIIHLFTKHNLCIKYIAIFLKVTQN